MLTEAIQANTNADSLRSESGVGIGPNEDAVIGPIEDADIEPIEDAADAGAGPNEDAGAGPVDLTTPKPFVEQPHFIRSNRSSTGYKGVLKDKRGGWRTKSGKTIGRYNTKAEACQAYYEYCLQNDLLFSSRNFTGR